MYIKCISSLPKMRLVVLAVTLTAAASAAAFECNECSLGKLLGDGFAQLQGCDTMAAQQLVAAFESQHPSCVPIQTAHQAPYEKCKDLTVAATTAQCLLHSGGKAWVIAATTALTYMSILPVAMSLRPSLAVKCD